MAFPTPEELRALVSPLAESLGLDVEGIRVTKAGKKSVVAIIVDGDERPGLDDLEKLSQLASQTFDDAEDAGQVSFGPGYSLEVTTPGVDHPLTQPKHFRRARGRLVKLPHSEGVARLGALSDDEATVILVEGTSRVRVASVESMAGAVVEIEFAAAPPIEAERAAMDYDEAYALSQED